MQLKLYIPNLFDGEMSFGWEPWNEGQDDKNDQHIPGD